MNKLRIGVPVNLPRRDYSREGRPAGGERRYCTTYFLTRSRLNHTESIRSGDSHSYGFCSLITFSESSFKSAQSCKARAIGRPPLSTEVLSLWSSFSFTCPNSQTRGRGDM